MDRARSKPSGGRFQSLVDHIYGPYPDHVFLEDELKPKPAQDGFLDLACVTLYAGTKPIGLDQSEYIIKPPKTSFVHEDHPKHVAISFCGILEVRDIAWLSKRGRTLLERDVRNQDKAIVPHNKERRELSLEQVLNSARGGQRFKVYLMCRKRQLAHYLTALKSPTRQHELLIYSGSSDGLVKRKFAVKSLHAATFVASKTFLARYRLRALLAELSMIDNDETPANHKDYNWVVNNYLVHILPRDMEAERRRKLRPISELSPYSDDLRYPRHIPSSQLRSELAEHSEWILANQIAKNGTIRDVRKNLVFIPSWIEWCEEAYLASIEAKKKGVKWGLSESVDLKNLKRKSLEQRLSKFGESPEFWKSHLQTWMKCSQRYVEECRDKPVLTTQGISSQQPSTTYGGLEYDSEFSDAYTTSEWSDFDDVNFSELRGPLKGVSFCSQPPQIPLGYFVWHCPGDCGKKIDLLNPSPQDISLLPPDLARVLKTKRWSVQESPIQQALAEMVSHHYLEHAELAGLRQVSTKTGPHFRLSEAQQKRKPRKKARSSEIKEEDSS